MLGVEGHTQHAHAADYSVAAEDLEGHDEGVLGQVAREGRVQGGREIEEAVCWW